VNISENLKPKSVSQSVKGSLTQDFQAVYTGEELFSGVNDTGEKFFAGVINV
jgi:hypothetical protein